MATIGPEFLLLGTRQDQGTWTVTVSPAADPSFPIANILEPGMAKVYQSLPGDDTVTIDIDRGAGTLPEMAGIVLFGLGVEPNSAITVQSSSGPSFATLGVNITTTSVDLSGCGSQPFRPPWGDTCAVVFSSTTAHRYLRVVLATVEGGSIRVAGIVGSGYWQHSANHEIDLGYAPEGALRSQVSPRDPRYVFFGMDIPVAADAQNISRGLGSFGRFAWVPSPADRTTYANTAGYGTFKEPPREVAAAGSGGKWRVTTMAFLEATR